MTTRRWRPAAKAFSQARAIDDEFRNKFARPFDIVMRGLASALQERYAALLNRAQEIAAMTPASGIKAFVGEIPGAGQLQHRFFENLASEDWLPLLDQKACSAGRSSLRKRTTPVFANGRSDGMPPGI